MAKRTKRSEADALGNHLRDELRQRKPMMAERAQTSRSAAIRLFCLECMGGNAASVRECTQKTCFLWPYRMGRRQDV